MFRTFDSWGGVAGRQGMRVEVVSEEREGRLSAYVSEARYRHLCQE